jgi:ABC-2 type transport system permease protein
MDLQSDMLPFVVGGTMENPQFEFLHWNYFPLLNASGNKLTNLGYVSGKFVNSIDTIKVDNVRKTPLLVTSANSRTISTPARISLNENRSVPQDDQFKKIGIPAALLLEGKFTSLYRNRISQAQKDSLRAYGTTYRQEGTEDGKMIVVGDGDIVLNDFILDPQTRRPVPLPMGFNKYTFGEYQKQTDEGKFFVPVANREFVQSAMEYLSNNPAITETRNKDIVLRLLDSQKISEQKLTWQIINILVPVVMIILFGLIYQQVRKRKYIQ